MGIIFVAMPDPCSWHIIRRELFLLARLVNQISVAAVHLAYFDIIVVCLSILLI